MLRILTCALALSAVLPTLGRAQEKSKTYCYYREEGDTRILDFQWIVSESPRGTVLVGQTFRPDVRMRLKLWLDPKGRLEKICVTEADGYGSFIAQAGYDNGGVKIERIPGKLLEIFSFERNPVVMTSPDRGDIMQLVRRYDRDKGGKQSPQGLWVHPRKMAAWVPVSIEKVGEDTIDIEDKKVKLDRFKVNVPAGEHVAWSDPDRVVYKIVPAGKPDDFVALEKAFDAVRQLGR